MTSSISPFVYKTYQLISDSKTNEVVSWSVDGTSMLIWNVENFEKQVLPKYFKHNNFSSFVRQLNTYDFHKVTSTKSMALEYHHQYFSRDRPQDLSKIKRKKTSKKETSATVQNSTLFGSVPIPSPEEIARFSSTTPPPCASVNPQNIPSPAVTKYSFDAPTAREIERANFPITPPQENEASLETIMQLYESQLETERRISSLAEQWRRAKSKLDSLLASQEQKGNLQHMHRASFSADSSSSRLPF